MPIARRRRRRSSPAQQPGALERASAAALRPRSPHGSSPALARTWRRGRLAAHLEHARRARSSRIAGGVPAAPASQAPGRVRRASSRPSAPAIDGPRPAAAAATIRRRGFVHDGDAHGRASSNPTPPSRARHGPDFRPPRAPPLHRHPARALVAVREDHRRHCRHSDDGSTSTHVPPLRRRARNDHHVAPRAAHRQAARRTREPRRARRRVVLVQQTQTCRSTQ